MFNIIKCLSFVIINFFLLCVSEKLSEIKFHCESICEADLNIIRNYYLYFLKKQQFSLSAAILYHVINCR